MAISIGKGARRICAEGRGAGDCGGEQRAVLEQRRHAALKLHSSMSVDAHLHEGLEGLAAVSRRPHHSISCLQHSFFLLPSLEGRLAPKCLETGQKQSG